MGLTDPLVDADVFLPVDNVFSNIWLWVIDHVVPDRGYLRRKAQEIGLAHFSIENAARSYLTALQD